MINVLPTDLVGEKWKYDLTWGTANSSIHSFRINLGIWQTEWWNVGFSIYTFTHYDHYNDGFAHQISGPYYASNENPYIDVTLDVMWDYMIFLRHEGSGKYLNVENFWGDVWNQTDDLKLDHTKTVYTITSLSGGNNGHATLTIE